MSQHRDPDVAEALRRLEVPDHGPDFWAAIESRLADEDLATDGEVPDDDGEADVVDLAASPAAHRRLAARNRTPVLVLVAAVAVVVALVVGAGMLAAPPDEDSRIDTAGEGADAPPAPTVPVPDTVPEPEVPASPAPDGRAVEWIDRLFAGDVEAAYELLDDTSRSLMSFADFELLGSGLFEGAAAFAVDGIERRTVAYDSAIGSFHVVTFTGQVEREGMIETASYPVVLTATGVHFVIDGPQLELDPEYADGSGTTLASPLVVLVGPGADAWVSFDAGAPETVAARGTVTIDVEAAAGAGTHLVDMVAVEGDRITARAWTVVVP
jgi:hypothetical protein